MFILAIQEYRGRFMNSLRGRVVDQSTRVMEGFPKTRKLRHICRIAIIECLDVIGRNHGKIEVKNGWENGEKQESQ